MQDELDQRCTQVFLTESGHTVAKIVNQVISDWIELISNGVSDDEIEIVDRVFDKFSANAENYVLNVHALIGLILNLTLPIMGYFAYKKGSRSL